MYRSKLRTNHNLMSSLPPDIDEDPPTLELNQEATKLSDKNSDMFRDNVAILMHLRKSQHLHISDN